MPAKGETCQLGKYKGSLLESHQYLGVLLSLPREARRILRSIDSAPPELRIAFDRGAGLYQVGAVVGAQFPTVGLAYRVAALDTISQANGSRRIIGDFVRKYAHSAPNAALIDYLWGAIRSAHFHGGEFPLGEFSPLPFHYPLMDSVASMRDVVHLRCYEVTREVIVRWLFDQLPAATNDETKEMST
jgi:hypothetical protein